MADTFGLEIYASNKLAFAGRAKTLTIPAVDGEQSVLSQHDNIGSFIIRILCKINGIMIIFIIIPMYILFCISRIFI